MSPLKNGFSIAIIYKPSVLDDVTIFCVFNDDQQILHLMDNKDIFKDASIEEDEHNKALQEAFHAMKENVMPKGVLSLEKLYDLKNRFKRQINTKTQSSNLHLNNSTWDLKMIQGM